MHCHNDTHVTKKSTKYWKDYICINSDASRSGVFISSIDKTRKHLLLALLFFFFCSSTISYLLSTLYHTPTIEKFIESMHEVQAVVE